MSPIVIAITLFVLALIIGIAVIGRVPVTLHTPLMSGANSIHGVVLVGVIIIAAQTDSLLGNIIIFFAALLGTLNVVGGYVVTDRMLDMFKPKKEVTSEDQSIESYQQLDSSDANFGSFSIEVNEPTTQKVTQSKVSENESFSFEISTDQKRLDSKSEAK